LVAGLLDRSGDIQVGRTISGKGTTAMETARAHGAFHRRALDPAPGGRAATLERTLARRGRERRAGVPTALFLAGCAVVLVVLLVALGDLVAKVLDGTALGHADASIARWFAARRTPGLDRATHYATLAAETVTITVLAAVTVAFTALRWRRWREPMLVATAVVGEVTIFLLVTLLVERQRPPVRHLDQAPPTSSFPSGHVAAAICMYGALALLANERARSTLVRGLFWTLALLVPLAVAVSRMYRGMHYLTDVLGGVLLGVVWLYVATRGIRIGVVHHQLRQAPGLLRRGRRRYR
jgi:membrane-associated phospholipid phosphatase